MAVESHLYGPLRAFCLAAFAALVREAGQGDEVPFVLEEHGGLYEYRPLLRDHVEARISALEQLDDAALAIAELRREPAAAIFAQGDAADPALFRAILVPLLVATVEACGGFDWEDGAFNRAYGRLEHSLFGASRAYTAAVPLVGLSVPVPIDLARGVQVRPSGVAELLAGRPDSTDGLPERFGEEPERSCALGFERGLAAGETALPDAPWKLLMLTPSGNVRLSALKPWTGSLNLTVTGIEAFTVVEGVVEASTTNGPAITGVVMVCEPASLGMPCGSLRATPAGTWTWMSIVEPNCPAPGLGVRVKL